MDTRDANMTGRRHSSTVPSLSLKRVNDDPSVSWMVQFLFLVLYIHTRTHPMHMFSPFFIYLEVVIDFDVGSTREWPKWCVVFWCRHPEIPGRAHEMYTSSVCRPNACRHCQNVAHARERVMASLVHIFLRHYIV